MPKSGYMLILKGTNLNPADGVNYMIWQSFTTSGVATNGRCAIPKNGKIREITFSATVAATLGSSETSSIYLNRNGTPADILLSNAITFTAVNNTFTISGLSIDVTTSDYINIQLTCATRVTNPTNVDIAAYIRIE